MGDGGGWRGQLYVANIRILEVRYFKTLCNLQLSVLYCVYCTVCTVLYEHIESDRPEIRDYIAQYSTIDNIWHAVDTM